MYFTAKVNIDKCDGCKMCVLHCPDPNVIIYFPQQKTIQINEFRCKGCGVCVTVCKHEALSVSLSTSR